ncbi:MAG: right-handed parallel beta-helix repeat-containing protein [Candidatus Heimdallarchaeota archaeon]|nr:MAG: right-handed parallel beta-helix repeat-containing protein [Candidatus Heimdallarchaeota archaeon]
MASLKRIMVMGVFLLLGSLFLASFFVSGYVLRPPKWSHPQKSAYSNDLTPHEPISITSDTELAAVAARGLGTEKDPFILEGWNITTVETHGIAISRTSKHFVIQNCWILVIYKQITSLPEASTPYGEEYPPVYYGIQIKNTTNGTTTVQNNSCQTQGIGFGIIIWEAVSTFVTNNSCFNNHYGINVGYSPSSIISNNTCNQNGIGIVITNSRSCHISHNVCNSNPLYGITTSFSGFSIVVNNTSNRNGIGLYVYYCAFIVVANSTFNNQTTRHGIFLEHATKCLVANNTLSQNDEDGIHLSGSSSNTICWNLIQKNYLYGIQIAGLEKHGDLCQNNLVHHNTFIENGASASSPQAYDKGFNSRYGWNYWSDYDGIGIYSIPGTAVAFDPHPLLQFAVSGSSIPIETDLVAPNIINVTRNPFSPAAEDKCIISATITDESGISNVFLHYQVINEEILLSNEETLEMNLTSDNRYQGIIGPFPTGSEICYTILTIDSSEFQNKARVKDSYSIELFANSTTTSMTTSHSISSASSPGWLLLLFPFFCTFLVFLRRLNEKLDS